MYERNSKCRQNIIVVIVLYQERVGAHQTAGNDYSLFVVIDSRNASPLSETNLLQLYSSFCKRNELFCQNEQFKVYRQKLKGLCLLTRIH